MMCPDHRGTGSGRRIASGPDLGGELRAPESDRHPIRPSRGGLPDPAPGFLRPDVHDLGARGLRIVTQDRAALGCCQIGAAFSFVTFAVYTIAVITRVGVFLDAMTRRPDWQNLMERFRVSGFGTLRGFVNYEYATGAPFKILIASMIGVATGLVGGLLRWRSRC